MGSIKQPHDVFAAGKEPLEQLARGDRLVVVEVHVPGGVEKASTVSAATRTARPTTG
jgi:hypothetical protein